MALVKCKECGSQVSTKAAACPQCGAKQPKQTSMATWFVGGLFVFVVGSMVFGGNKSGSPPQGTSMALASPAKPMEKTPEQVKADVEINTAIAVIKAIKAGTKNPASFKLEVFLIYPGGATCYEYSGTNSFNAVVPGKAVFDPAKPAILTSDRDGNKFIKAWNDICTKPGGQERAGGLNLLGAI